jgi:capsular exopolysaccharide synthesis family protein
VDNYLNLPELGVIPAVRSAGSVALTLDRKPTLLAESFRACLTSILVALDWSRSAKVMVVTSANPCEGKSTVSSNLAVALAEINRRVLLIDGDLRQPTLHKLFNVNSNPTLVDLVNGTRNIEEMDSRQVLAESNIPNLYVLTAGDTDANVTSVLHSPRLRELISQFRKEFDVVLIDTPPMLHLPDARLLSRDSDGVILVIRSGKTSKDAAVAVAQRLLEDKVPILGTILNSWNHTRDYRNVYGKYGMKS